MTEMKNRRQSRDAMTFAELEGWGAQVVTKVDEVTIPPHHLAPGPITRTFPACPGCAGRVRVCEPAAITIDTAGKGVTFRPCGCVLAVPDMPDGWWQ